MTSYSDTISEALTLDHSVDWTWSTYLSDAMTVSQPGNHYDFRSLRTISEYINIGLAQSPTWHLSTTVRDVIRVSEALLKLYDSVVVTEGINVSSTFNLYKFGVRAIVEGISFDEILQVGIRWAGNAADTVNLTSTAQPTYGAKVAETIAMTGLASASRHWLVMEAFQIIDAIHVNGIYGRSLQDAVTVADSVARFLGASVSDVMAIVEAVSRKRSMKPVLAQTIQVSDHVDRALLVQAVAADTVEITHDQVLQMIFSPVLAEGVLITAAHFDPSGSITSWAINVQNGGVTEYTNFAFNSFAAAGSKYYGADETGLYELDGETDADQAIIAKMQTGITQFMQSHTGSIKGAYLGLRGGGDWYLKINADDKVYVYKVTAKDMKSTRVQIGKGIRARYFSFELTSTGQEFDLDSVEFLPIVNQRRV